VVIALAETLERRKMAAIQAGAKQVSLSVPAVDGGVVVLVYTNEEDPLLPPAGVQWYVFKLEEMVKLTKMKSVDFSTVITTASSSTIIEPRQYLVSDKYVSIMLPKRFKLIA